MRPQIGHATQAFLTVASAFLTTIAYGFVRSDGAHRQRSGDRFGRAEGAGGVLANEGCKHSAGPPGADPKQRARGLLAPCARLEACPSL